MQKNNFIRLLLVFLTMFCFVCCEYDIIEEEQIVIPPNQEVSFDQDIIPIFTANCTSCHDGGIDPDLRSDNAYTALVNGGYLDTDNPSNSELYKVLLEGSHQTRASATEKELILEWITRGANNN